MSRLGDYLRRITRRDGPPRRAEPAGAAPLPWGGFGLSSPLLEGPRVEALQDALVRVGALNPADVTGRYDEATAAAVLDLKRRRGIAVPEGHEDRASPDLLRSLGLPEGPP